MLTVDMGSGHVPPRLLQKKKKKISKMSISFWLKISTRPCGRSEASRDLRHLRKEEENKTKCQSPLRFKQKKIQKIVKNFLVKKFKPAL